MKYISEIKESNWNRALKIWKITSKLRRLEKACI